MRGDENILSYFRSLQEMFRSHGETAYQISSLLEQAVAKLNALIHQTPQNKLKCIGTPPIMEISGKIDKSISQLYKIKEDITKSIQNIDEALKNAKVKCSDCGGEGKKAYYKYIREEDIVTPIQTFEPCPTCNGLGYLKISEDVRRVGYEILKSIGKIR
jgi:DNA-directed RNA polymerase subunit M/transcription elongation factor TFIIS